MDLSKQTATGIGRSWNERGHCGDAYLVQQIKREFRDHFNYAYSSGGLDMSKQSAIRYAIERVAHMTACSDLLIR
jgi:hypothetical protein